MLKILRTLFLVVFVIGCTKQTPSPYGLTQIEHESLKSVFSLLLFEGGGAYTLFGDKPLTFEIICNISSIPEDARSYTINSENWKNGWDQIKDKIKTPLFLIVERKAPWSDLRAVFFVNIATCAMTLQQHYAKFRDFVGFDFDPLQIIFEIENEDSLFWSKVLPEDYYLGILLGYGEENSWLCSLHHHMKNEIGPEDKKSSFLKTLFAQSPSSNSGAKTTDDIHFLLPSFGAYSPQQSVLLIEKYKQDRERIRQIYKDKDIVQVTLDRLTSKDLPEDPDKDFKALYRKAYNMSDNR